MAILKSICLSMTGTFVIMRLAFPSESPPFAIVYAVVILWSIWVGIHTGQSDSD